MIYFLKSPQGPIKIGTTIRLSERLRALTKEYGDGLEVLAVAEGSYSTETELHRRFAHLKVVNEWFEPGDDLLGFIVSEAKPWDGMDESPKMTTVKFDSILASKARIVASDRGIDLAKYVSDALRSIVELDWSKIVKRIDSTEDQG